MFPFGHNHYTPAYQSYDPYEQALLQQEVQRRRQAEEYQRRRQLEALNRRRAEQLEYARRQAEIQRLREAEARRRHQTELEARRRKLSEPGSPQIPRPRIRVPEPYEQPAQRSAGRPQSMFDGGVQDLFDALYGNRGHPNAPSQSNARRAKSSDPRARSPADPALATEPTQNSAISDTKDGKDPAPPSGPAPKTSPAAPTPPLETGAEPIEVDTTKAQSEISNILKSLSDLKAGFSFPAKLDFLSSPGDATVTVPKLAYTPNNAPLHQFEHLLTGLLTKLDAVDSCGQDSIRKARKDAVKAIEKELEDVDLKKLQEWQRQSQEVVAATSAPSFPDSEPPKESPNETLTNQAQPTLGSTPQVRNENEDAPSNTPSQQDDSSSIALATPPAQPADLQSSSDNTKSHRAATPTPTPNPPLANTTEASSTDAEKPSQGEAIEEGYVDIGREDAGSDNTDDETTRSRANPDDSWEAEF